MKNKLLKTLAAFLLMLLCLTAISCDFDESRDNFRGGELLNQEIMESIRNTFTTVEQESDSATEKNEESNTQADSSRQDDSEQQESDQQQESQTYPNEAKIVYWTASGSVWHEDSDCRYIKNKQYVTGTVEQAKEAGIGHGCSFCAQ